LRIDIRFQLFDCEIAKTVRVANAEILVDERKAEGLGKETQDQPLGNAGKETVDSQLQTEADRRVGDLVRLLEESERPLVVPHVTSHRAEVTQRHADADEVSDLASDAERLVERVDGGLEVA